MNRQGVAYTLDPKDLDEVDFGIETVFEVEKKQDLAARLQMARGAVESGMMSKVRALQDFMGYEDGPLVMKEALIERAMEELMPELIQDALQEAFPLINERLQKEQAAFQTEQVAATNPALAQLMAETIPPGGPGSEAMAAFMAQNPMAPPQAGVPQRMAAPPPQAGVPLPPLKGPVNGRVAGAAKRPGGPRRVAQPYTRSP